MIGLIAQIKTDLEELGEAIYRALDPDHASGAWLGQRVAYAGITKRGARYSYLRSATLGGTVDTVIEAGALIEDESRIRWQLVDTVTIGLDGTVRSDFRCVDLGKFGLAQVSELKILTIVTGREGGVGWESVTLNAPAEEGAEEELDPELRARFLKRRSRPAQNSVDAIEARVGELPDVRQVVCLENMGDTEDENGVPGHGINVIVDGGASDAIALVILQNKTAGAPMLGDQQVIVVDAKGRARIIKYDRPTDVDCAASLTVKRSKNFTAIDTDGITKALAAEQFEIGEAVERSRLYSLINTVPGFSVSSFTIGLVGGALSELDIAIGDWIKMQNMIADLGGGNWKAPNLEDAFMRMDGTDVDTANARALGSKQIDSAKAPPILTWGSTGFDSNGGAFVVVADSQANGTALGLSSSVYSNNGKETRGPSSATAPFIRV